MCLDLGLDHKQRVTTTDEIKSNEKKQIMQINKEFDKSHVRTFPWASEQKYEWTNPVYEYLHTEVVHGIYIQFKFSEKTIQTTKKSRQQHMYH